MIMTARKAMLYMDGTPYSKKGGGVFDIGMGFYDGAECCEIVGLFLLSELEELGIDVGIYRDDGLAVANLTPQEVDRLKKKICAIFKKHKLKITIEANKVAVDFLDITLDLQKD